MSAKKIDKLFSARNILLFCTGALALFYYCMFFMTKRLPLGHDTLQYLQCQYMFFNELVTHKEFPLWLPYMTKGTVSNWWFMISNGLLSNAFYLVAPLLEHFDYYWFFYASLFFDELCLLVGTILLSGLFYKNRLPVFFVATAMLASVNWSSQIWWNFHLYYLIPLMLYFFIKAYRDFSIKHLLLGGLFLYLSFYGNLMYFFPVLTFFVFSFIFILFMSDTTRLMFRMNKMHLSVKLDMYKQELKKLSILTYLREHRSNIWKIVLAMVVISVPFSIMFMFFKHLGAAQIANNNFGRAASGVVDLSVFLSYGGSINFKKFLELITGVSYSLDQTFYIGIIGITFFIVGILLFLKGIIKDKTVTALIILLLLGISFTTGGFIAKLAYCFWPMMNLFRHIGLVNSILKLFVLFLAGFGLDHVLSLLRDDSSFRTAKFNPILKCILSTLTVILVIKSLIYVLPRPLELFFVENGLLQNKAYFDLSIFKIISVICVAGALFFTWAHISKRTPKSIYVLLLVLTMINIVDLSIHRSVYYEKQLPALHKKEIEAGYLGLFKVHTYKYACDRTQDYLNNERSRTFLSVVYDNSQKKELQEITRGEYGALYWNNESFFYFDNVASIFRTDHRLNSIDNFYNIFGPVPQGFLETPYKKNAAFKKYIGDHYPKVQFFKTLYYFNQASTIKQIIANDAFHGDIVMAIAPDDRAAVVATSEQSILYDDQRIQIPFTIKKFSFNRLQLVVDNIMVHNVVLFYSEAYHKVWRATVNRKATDVINANIGFMAVVIPPGISTVDLYFHRESTYVATRIILSLGVLAVVIVFFLSMKMLKGQNQ